MANPNVRKSAKQHEPLHWHQVAIIFIVGAFGGMAPFALRFAMDLLNERDHLSHLTVDFIGGIAILATLGGGVAAVWREIDLKKAFALGLGLPAMLTVAVSNTRADRNNSQISSTVALLTVWAADQPSADSAPRRSMTVSWSTKPPSDRVRVEFSIPHGAGLSYAQPDISINVADEATAFVLNSPDGSSESISLPLHPYAMFSFRFRATPSALYGFWYALGRHVKPFRFVLESSKETSFADAVLELASNASDDFSRIRNETTRDTSARVETYHSTVVPPGAYPYPIIWLFSPEGGGPQLFADYYDGPNLPEATKTFDVLKSLLSAGLTNWKSSTFASNPSIPSPADMTSISFHNNSNPAQITILMTTQKLRTGVHTSARVQLSVGKAQQLPASAR